MAIQRNTKRNQKVIKIGKEPSSTWIKTLFLMIMLLLAYDIYAIGFGEKLTVHDGLGWDGETYGNIIKDFKNLVFHKNLQEFTIGRILPLTIIYYSMQFFRNSITNSNIILMFQIFNSLLMLISVVLWINITKQLKLSKWGAWIGILALFINFGNLKNPIYYSVGTDPATFFLGILLLFLFIKKKPWGILITSILAAFVSPTMIYFGMLLFIFKEREIEFDKNEKPMPDASFMNIIQKYKHIIISFIICLIILCGIVYSNFMIGFILPNDAVAPVEGLVLFSIITLMAFLLMLFAQLFNDKNNVNVLKILKSVDLYKLAVSVIIFVLIQFVYKQLGNPNFDETLHFSFYVKTIMRVAIAKPFITIISAIVWYGPLLLITLIALKKFTNEIHKYGYGLLFALIAGFLLLFLDSESRHAIVIYPFICAFTVKAIDKQINKNFLFTFTLLSVVFSKIWFPINPLPEEGGNLWEFPMQRNFMNYGLWMANQPYAIQGLAVLCSFLIIYFLYKDVNIINQPSIESNERKPIPIKAKTLVKS